MKTIIILLLTIGSLVTTAQVQETETMKAIFNEYAEGIYHFTDSEGYSIEFEHIQKVVLAKYDLSIDKFKGKQFIITYETDTEEDEEGDDILTFVIVDLKAVE